MRKDNGFTLVEMMVVIAIMATVSAIAVPNFYSFATGMKLRSASRDLYSYMQKARMNAIRENTTWTVRFAGSGYSLVNSGTVVNIPNEYSGIVLSGQNFVDSQANFFSDGTSNGGTVTFSNSSGQQSSVNVLASGRIKST